MKQKLFQLFICTLLLTLTSCNDGNQYFEGINLVVVVGNRANSYALTDGDFEIIESFIERAFIPTSGFNARANVAFIVSDGRPWRADLPNVEQMGSRLDVNPLIVTANNSTTREQRITENIRHGIVPFIQSNEFRARHTEADLLAALWMATDEIRRMDGDGDSYILIIDSGITTTGHLDLTNVDIQSEDLTYTEIIVRLQQAGALPDMNGINVVFEGIGNSAGFQVVPQNTIFRDQLIGLWSELLVASGASITCRNGHSLDLIAWSSPGVVPNEHFETIPDSIDANNQPFLFVSTVFFRDVDPWGGLGDVLVGIGTDPTEASSNAGGIFDAGIILPMAQLGFLPNSDDFYNIDNATQLLQSISYDMNLFLEQNPESRIYIVGSEARVSMERENDGTVSTRRANRVRNILIDSFDIPYYRLVAIGANTTIFSWRNTDEFVNGVHEPLNARQNMVVAIIPYGTTRFEELRAANFVY